MPDASPAKDTPASLPAAERIPTLDILRGFALMGILIMNMPGFSQSGWAEADGSHLWTSRIDQVAEQVRDALFSGKFNSLFSLLFGIGFTIQFARMQQHDPLHASALYLRRLLVLLAFGLVHAFVFWSGDVLHTYALLGLLLLFGLRRLSDRGVVALIAACLAWPTVVSLIRLASATKADVAARVARAQGHEITNDLAYGSGSFIDTALETARDTLAFYAEPGAWSRVSVWLAMMAMTMMIGLIAGRRRWPQRIAELMPRIRRLTWWALAVGIGGGVAATVIFELNRVPGPTPIKVLGGLCYQLGRVSMMIFYVLVIVRLAQHPAWRRWLAPFAAAGRMPLTNYLMQTAVCTTLFYGWGFGWWLQVGPANGLLLALAIFFLVQVPWSLWWLRRHDRGPLERLWSRLTHGRGGGAGRLPAPSAGTALPPALHR